MSDFFKPPEPLPEPEPQRRYRQQPWWAPPEGTLPGVVAVELVLAQTPSIAVCLSSLVAYPTGFGFEIVTFGSPDEELDLDPFEMHRAMFRRSGTEGLSDNLLRIGVEFSDGRKATNTGGFADPRKAPDGPVMQAHGGGGGGASWRQNAWVWPLPPPGPLTVVCEWPRFGIPLTRTEIDAQLVLDAATRAQVIFSEEHLPFWDEEDDDGPDVQIIR